MYNRLIKRKRIVTTFFILILLTSTFFTLLMLRIRASTLQDVSQDQGFLSYYVLAEPNQIQEGHNTTIIVGVRGAETNSIQNLMINITAPTGVSYTSSLSFVTNETGAGSGSLDYWKDFPNANTNSVGVYKIAVNETITDGTFLVLLTEKLEYRVEEKVTIRASGYGSNEVVSVDIRTSGVSVAGYPRNVEALEDGLVTDTWDIPPEITRGNYTVALVNTVTSGTVKTPIDSQEFMVDAAVLIQTRNLANRPVPDMTVEVYDATKNQPMDISETTNETGWVRIELDAGNYTFKAFLADVEIGSLVNQRVWGLVILTLECSLSNFKINVENESGFPLPFIDITLTFNITTRYNDTIPGNLSFKTNSTGSIITRDVFANVGYLIEVRRYDMIFNRTFVPDSNQILEKGWANITFKCPSYTVFLNTLDSTEEPISKAQIEIYEFNGQVFLDSKTTDENGKTFFNLTFGRYSIRVHYNSAELKDRVLINETIIDLTEDRSQKIKCNILNINPTAVIVDYFGQPIPNVIVEMERSIRNEWVRIEPSGKTDSKGVVLLPSIGGAYRLSVYIRDELCEIRTLYLDQTRQISFKMDKYVNTIGNPIATSQLQTIVISSLIVTSLLLTMIYSRITVFSRKSSGETKSKTYTDK